MCSWLPGRPPDLSGPNGVCLGASAEDQEVGICSLACLQAAAAFPPGACSFTAGVAPSLSQTRASPLLSPWPEERVPTG